MKIHILFFAQLREIAETEEKVLVLADRSCVRDVCKYFFNQPGFQMVRGLPMRAAVNEVFVDSSHVLKEGDRLAFIPPVAGG